MRARHLCAVVCVALVTARNAYAVVLFSDDFNSAASATNYTPVMTADTNVTHAFDYSALGIPAAPHTTDASTRGLKLEANIVTPASIDSVTLLTNQQFTGAYTVQFDMWINANGPFDATGVPTSVGSTQFLTAGIGGSGNANNGSTTLTSAQNGSGGWTAVTGDADAARDFRLHKNGAEQTLASGQYSAGTAAGSQDNANAYYGQFTGINLANLPVQGASHVPSPGSYVPQNGTTPKGCVGFAWRTVNLEVNPTGGTGGAASMTWSIDDLRIGKLDAGGTGGSFASDGSVTIGYWDAFNSVSDNPALSFGLIDNLRVSTTPAINADFNGDLEVNAADYVSWRAHNFSPSGASHSDGDADGDEDVENSDYLRWKAAFGNPAPASSTVLNTIAPVPEPSAVMIVLTGLAVYALRRRRYACHAGGAKHGIRAKHSRVCADPWKSFNICLTPLRFGMHDKRLRRSFLGLPFTGCID